MEAGNGSGGNLRLIRKFGVWTYGSPLSLTLIFVPPRFPARERSPSLRNLGYVTIQFTRTRDPTVAEIFPSRKLG
jgi:hypothetical protein